MRPAAGKDNGTLLRQPLEARIAVNLQNAGESLQVSLWSLRFAIRTVEVNRGRRVFTRPWPVIPSVDPQSTGLSFPSTRIEYGDRRVVGEDLAGSKDLSGQQIMKRFQPPAGPAHPVGQGRPVKLHTKTAQNLGLTIERQMVAVLTHQHLGDQTGCGHALGDHPLRCRSLMDSATGPTTMFGPIDTDDPDRRRHPVQHLRGRHADLM